MKTRIPYSTHTFAQKACIILLACGTLLCGCKKRPFSRPESDQPAYLSIAEANWSNGSSQIIANTTPDSKAFNSGNGLSTQFSEGDRLGLFLRGDSYEPVDNRMVTYTPEEGEIITKWVIDGNPIGLNNNEATLTAYFPYSEYGKLTMDSIPLIAGAYNVNTNDVVWQRDVVHAQKTEAMFLNMEHAMTRVKLIFSKTPATDPTTYLGAGKIEAVQIADANTVAEEDQVIYVDGFLNLETETPTILPAVRGRVIISETKTLSEEGVLYDFLLLPVAAINPDAVQLHILIDDKTITTEFPTSLINAWKAGTAYTYEITVRNGDSQVVFGKVGTTPWNYGGKISGDLDPSNPEYGGGDVEDWGNNGWGVEIDGPGSLEVSPDPTNIAYTGAEFTVAWTHVWNASVTLPVRVIEEGQGTVLSSGEVTSTSTDVKLTVPENTVPENTAPNKARQIVFQYQWNGEWKEFDRGTQAAEPAALTQTAMSSDPSSGFSSATNSFTVTFTGKWPGSIPVRAIEESTSKVLASVAATTSGTGVKLTVPNNPYPNPARSIVFQYQWEGQWIELGQGTQALGEGLDKGFAFEIAPTSASGKSWADAITYCSDIGEGWRLPTTCEMLFMFCVAPAFSGSEAFASSYHWSGTSYGNNKVYANFGTGYCKSAATTTAYNVRCVRTKEPTGEQTYPYITTADDGGVVIVLRDENGGVGEGALFSSRKTTTTTGNLWSSDNRMSRKIRVQKANPGKMTLANAISYCNDLDTEGYDDWRLPSQREVMVLCAMGANNTVLTSGYANSTGVGDNSVQPICSPYLYQQSGFSAFAADRYWTASIENASKSMCVSFASDTGQGGSTSSTYSHYIRCVRDEW